MMRTQRNWAVLILASVLMMLISSDLLAQTPFTMTGSTKMTYDDGSEKTADIAIAGIEAVSPDELTLRGYVSILGETVPIELKGRRTVYEARYYRTELTIDGQTVRISILLGHPQDPTWGGFQAIDGRDPSNVGYGRGSMT